MVNCEATNTTYINALLPQGYSICHVDRENGDANFHMEKQPVKGSTHHLGHTLDVLISRDTNTLVTGVKIVDINSDDGTLVQEHYAIMFTIQHPSPVSNIRAVSYRNNKSLWLRPS